MNISPGLGKGQSSDSDPRVTAIKAITDLLDLYKNDYDNYFNPNYWQLQSNQYAQAVVQPVEDKLRPKIEDLTYQIILEMLPEEAGYADSVGNTFVTLGAQVGNFIREMQSNQIAFYMHTNTDYDYLYGKLGELKANSEQIVANSDGDQQLLQTLFEQRQNLLIDLYGHFPLYMTEVYHNIIQNFGALVPGVEGVYSTIRWIVENLRMEITLDYQSTRTWLTNLRGQYIPSTDLNAPLQPHSIDLYQSESVIYDSLDFIGDYTEYEINVDPALTNSGQTIMISISFPNVVGMKAYLNYGSSINPANPTGDLLTLSQSGGYLGASEVAQAGKYYLLVTSESSTSGALCGPYRLETLLQTYYWIFPSFTTIKLPVSVCSQGTIYSSGKVSQTSPEPSVTSVSIAPTSHDITFGDSFDVEVHATNLGGTSDWQSIALSFPGITDVNNIAIISSNLGNAPQIYGPGSTVASKYGINTIQLTYPLIEGSSINWQKDNDYFIRLRVHIENSGPFDFYVKSVAWGAGIWNSSPKIGDTEFVDQQSEFVYKDSFSYSVNPLSLSITPVSTVLGIGRSVLFSTDVSGGVSSYAYQWYLNGLSVSGANGNTWLFNPNTSSGVFSVYANVRDNAGNAVTSNTATVTVDPTINPVLSVSSQPLKLGVNTFAGSHFAPGTQYDLYVSVGGWGPNELNSQFRSGQGPWGVFLGSVVADSLGSFSVDLTFPSGYMNSYGWPSVYVYACEHSVTPQWFYGVSVDYQAPVLSVTNGPVRIGFSFHVLGEYFAPETMYNIKVVSSNGNPISLGSATTNGLGFIGASFTLDSNADLMLYSGGSTGSQICLFATESSIVPASNYFGYVDYQTPNSFTLSLSVGWNMVSFPVLPADTSFTDIFSGKGYYQVLTWTGTSYATPTNVEAGKGYWILVLVPTTISVEGTPVSSYSSDLNGGWNMVGSVNGGVVNCGSVFSGYYQLLTWSGTSYNTATTIDPGKGYWVLVLTPTHVTIG
jgi:hypothetical protein